MTDQERNLKAEPRSHPVRYRPVGITLARTIHAMLIHFPQSLLRVRGTDGSAGGHLFLTLPVLFLVLPGFFLASAGNLIREVSAVSGGARHRRPLPGAGRQRQPGAGPALARRWPASGRNDRSPGSWPSSSGRP